MSASKPHSERLRELLSTQPEGEGVVILSEDECLDALDDLNALVEQVETLRQLNDRVIAERDSWERECNGLSEQVEAAERVVEAARRVCHEEGWNASPARMRALDRALDAYPASEPEAS